MSRLWSVALCTLLMGCSAQLPRLPEATVGMEALLSGERLPENFRQADLSPFSSDQWLAADSAMLAFVARHTPDIPRHHLPQHITRSLLAPSRDPIHYQRGANLDASTVFRERRANCLSFSAMMISLLREAGLDARFQRVVTTPEWDLQDTSVVATLHVNTRVRTRGVYQEIDWARAQPKTALDRKSEMSDAEALAELYNNRGTEAMLAGQAVEAFANMRRALELAPRTAHIWVNLGAFYQRQGDGSAAESAWLTALRYEPGQRQAMSSLQRAYLRDGRQDIADQLATVLHSYREANPFFHFAQARLAMSERRFDDAINHLERALLLERDPRFVDLLRQARRAVSGEEAVILGQR